MSEDQKKTNNEAVSRQTEDPSTTNEPDGEEIPEHETDGTSADASLPADETAVAAEPDSASGSSKADAAADSPDDAIAEETGDAGDGTADKGETDDSTLPPETAEGPRRLDPASGEAFAKAEEEERNRRSILRSTGTDRSHFGSDEAPDTYVSIPEQSDESEEDSGQQTQGDSRYEEPQDGAEDEAAHKKRRNIIIAVAIAAAVAVIWIVAALSSQNNANGRTDLATPVPTETLVSTPEPTPEPTEEPTPSPARTADLALDAAATIDGMTYRYNSSWPDLTDALMQSYSRTYSIDMREAGSVELSVASMQDQALLEAVAPMKAQAPEEREAAVQEIQNASVSGLSHGRTHRNERTPAGTLAMWSFSGTQVTGEGVTQGIYGYEFIGDGCVYQIKTASSSDAAYAAFQPTFDAIVAGLTFPEITPVPTEEPTPEPTEVMTAAPIVAEPVSSGASLIKIGNLTPTEWLGASVEDVVNAFGPATEAASISGIQNRDEYPDVYMLGYQDYSFLFGSDGAEDYPGTCYAIEGRPGYATYNGEVLTGSFEDITSVLGVSPSIGGTIGKYDEGMVWRAVYRMDDYSVVALSSSELGSVYCIALCYENVPSTSLYALWS